MITVYIFKTFLANSTKPLKLIVTVVLFTPIHVTGILAGFIFPKNDHLFITNVVLAQKVAAENLPKIG